MIKRLAPLDLLTADAFVATPLIPLSALPPKTPLDRDHQNG
jgi:hypothetical protein